jgi:hypothetical protein
VLSCASMSWSGTSGWHLMCACVAGCRLLLCMAGCDLLLGMADTLCCAIPCGWHLMCACVAGCRLLVHAADTLGCAIPCGWGICQHWGVYSTFLAGCGVLSCTGFHYRWSSACTWKPVIGGALNVVDAFAVGQPGPACTCNLGCVVLCRLPDVRSFVDPSALILEPRLLACRGPSVEQCHIIWWRLWRRGSAPVVRPLRQLFLPLSTSTSDVAVAVAMYSVTLSACWQFPAQSVL